MKDFLDAHFSGVLAGCSIFPQCKSVFVFEI